MGSKGKVREFSHTGAEASRPKKHAPRSVARSQTTRRSTPAKGTINGMGGIIACKACRPQTMIERNRTPSVTLFRLGWLWEFRGGSTAGRPFSLRESERRCTTDANEKFQLGHSSFPHLPFPSPPGRQRRGESR